MNKILKVVIYALILILACKGGYSLYQEYFYGIPKKIEHSEEVMRDYLKEKKGYKDRDIIMIKGIHNWTASKEEKYGGTVVIKDNSKGYQEFDYGIYNNKIKEFEDIPSKN